MKSVFTLLFLAAAIALFVWVALPTWDQINSLRTEQASIQDALARLKELQGLRDSLLNTYNSIPKDQMDRLNKMMPKKADVGGLLVGFEQMSNSRGIKLRSIDFISDKALSARPPSVVSTSTASVASSLAYSLNISASYDHFRTFLLALERNLRLVDVTDISFSSGTAGVWEISLKAKSYYQK